MLASDYAGFLVDLDGVVYVGDQPVVGANEGIAELRAHDIPLRFVTNNSSSTRAEIRARLERLGIDADEDEIVSAAWATGRYLDEAGYDSVLVVGTDSLRAVLRRAGISVDGEDPEAVVVGHDETTGYAELTEATRLVHEQDLPVVGINADAAVPTSAGIVPGVGAITSVIETATGSETTVVGKPEPRLFEYAVDSLGTDDIAMIGDTPSADVRGAKRAGIGSILVAAHATRQPGDPKPDTVIRDLRGLFDLTYVVADADGPDAYNVRDTEEVADER
jgi:HAD superfamily hydrolase (TIGR01450 family)